MNENRINYKDLSYKIFFSEEDNNRFHETNFLRKYGRLYDLLDDLITRKITVDSANSDQIAFIIG